MANSFTLLKKGVFLIFFLCSFGLYAQNPTPSITLSTATPCVNIPINAAGSVSGGTATSWLWSSNPTAGASIGSSTAQNTAVTFSTAGTYTLTLTVQPGGTAATAIVTVSAAPVVTVTASTDTICTGGAGATITATGGNTYTWIPATGLSATNTAVVTATPTSTTTYTVIGTNNSCVDSVTQTIAVIGNTAVVAVSDKDSVCVGTLATLSATASGATFSWAPATGLSCTNCPNPQFTPTVVGTTTFVVTATGQCISPNTDTVIVKAISCKPIAGFTFPQPHWVCRWDCVQFTDTSKSGQLQYMWVFEGGLPDTVYNVKNPVVCYNVESALSPSGGGTYFIKLVVTNGMNMKDSVTQLITVLPTPLANINNGASSVTIQTGGAVTLDAGSWTLGASFFNWTPNSELSCNNCPAPVASPIFTTTYIVTAIGANGCKDKDTITVNVELRCGEVFVPNVFSPNKDGQNDVLHVNNNCLSSIEFRVFDRWGEQVYVSTDPKASWDGTCRGKELDPGVFVYFLEAVLSNGTNVSKKGNITLIR